MPPTSTLGSTPPCVSSQPVSDGRRRLAVRAGDDDRPRAPQKVLADRFGQRAVPDLPIEHFLELGIAARDRVADDDQVEIGGDVLRPIAGERRNAFGREKVAHRRIDVLIRSADVEALPLQHRGERRHRRAADADEVDRLAHWTAASSMTRRGCAIRRSTRHATPNGSVIGGPDGVAGRKPDTTGPGKSAKQVRHHGARGRLAGRLVALRQLADDDRAAPREQPGLPQLRHHPVEPVRTLADFVEEQDVSLRRREGERRAERRQQLRQRAAEQQAGRLPGPNRLERPAAPARPSARGGTAHARTSRAS